MRIIGLFLVLASICMMFTACNLVKSGKDPYTTDRLVVAGEYEDKSPANLMVFPVETEESLDFEDKLQLREYVYSLLMKKGYAPLALTFTDRTLRDLGRYHTPLWGEDAWNTEPFKEALAEYSDAVVFLTIDRYLESGQPGKSGILIWGKVGIFDTRSMELLFEHYTRQTLHPTDLGGGRERYIHQALKEFTEILLGALPPKITRK
ncbi:MAG: hypothetical protein KJ645_14225 [Planctomycetes bacterium]|nr:hypothetical protein [Planctomycetota bacterium]